MVGLNCLLVDILMDRFPFVLLRVNAPPPSRFLDTRLDILVSRGQPENWYRQLLWNYLSWQPQVYALHVSPSSSAFALYIERFAYYCGFYFTPFRPSNSDFGYIEEGESTAGYTFTPCVESFAWTGIDTPVQGYMYLKTGTFHQNRQQTLKCLLQFWPQNLTTHSGLEMHFKMFRQSTLF
jgi:hypothetical protein